MKRFLLLTKVSVLLVLLYSCNSQITREDAVKNLVGKYTYALTFAYKDGNFSELVNVSDGKALTMVDNTYQSYFTIAGIVLDAELLGLTFKKIELGSGENEAKIKVEWHEAEKEWREISVHKETFVETEERWKYKWVDKKTGELASPVVTAKYDMRYTIDKVGGSLKVISTEIKKQEVEKEEGKADRWKTVVGGTKGH